MAGRHKFLNIRVTDEQFAEIEKVAKNLKITKTEAVVRGIKNLSQIQPVYYRSQMPNFKPKKFRNILKALSKKIKIFLI